MRSKIFLFAAALLFATSAQAGTLQSVTLKLSVQGVPLTFTGTPTGASTSTTGTWAGGQMLPSSVLIPSSVVTSPVSKVTIMEGAASALSITQGSNPPTGGVIPANACVFIFGACAIALPVNSGLASTITGSSFGIFVGLTGQAWSTGMQTVTGLTLALTPGQATGTAQPNFVTTGSFNLNASGVGTVTLVSASRTTVKAGFVANSTTGGASRLTLVYVPEPGTLLLLGAGLAGLAALGRRRS